MPLFEKAVAGFKAATGADNQQTLSEMQKLGWVYQEVGRLTDAQQLLEETLRFQKAKSETDNPDVAQTLGELGLTLVREEKFAEAEPLLKQSLAIYEKQSPKNFLRFYCQSVLGAALVGEKKYADAERCFQTALKIYPGYDSGWANYIAMMFATNQAPKATALATQFATANPKITRTKTPEFRVRESGFAIHPTWRLTPTNPRNAAICKASPTAMFFLKPVWASERLIQVIPVTKMP